MLVVPLPLAGDATQPFTVVTVIRKSVSNLLLLSFRVFLNPIGITISIIDPITC